MGGGSKMNQVAKFIRPDSWDEYRQAWQRAEDLELLTRHPLHLDMELSGHCDLKCSMCWQSGKIDAKLGLMKDDLFKKVIDHGVGQGLVAVKLQSRGESLLHPRIAELARYAKNAGIMDLQLTTNGLLLAKGDRMEQLLASGLDKLIFSIDKGHDESAAQVYGERMPDVRKIAAEAIKFRDRLGQDTPKIRIQTFAEPGQSQEDRLTEVQAEFPNADEHMIHLLWNSNPLEDSVDKLLTEFEQFPCKYLWTRLAVFWNGDVTLCCRDYNCEMKLGNANEMNIEDIWLGERMSYLRRTHRQNRRADIPLCHHCDQSCRPVKRGMEGMAKKDTYLHVAGS
jgi:hypothetical protein